MLGAGYVVMRRKQVKYDYSKWLGPDSKIEFKGAGIYISNHTSPFDTPLSYFMMIPCVSFLGKKESENIPFLGSLCGPLMQLLIDREHKDESQQRNKVFA